ncbi:hypothetical protein [Chitinilyticum piscinae]|uniref:Uncharacterized protein n=1 Tax=Chitinilyticum piscinae TaxID=2866724 RepID=A0A8J7FJB4_9NEIS|nr:hypothetical protein [Chitinilyticum piscinae]MBE9610420.1 hypothetical protein [Chitinilyticum piscinae]
MNFHDLSRLIVRLSGAFIMTTALAWWPSYIQAALGLLPHAPLAFVGNALLPVALPLLIGLGLFLFPSVISQRGLPAAGDGQSLPPNWPAILERILLGLLGIYLLSRAMSDLVFGLIKRGAILNYFAEQAPGLPLPIEMASELYGNLVASAVELLVGLALILGAGGLQRVLARVRSSGH